MNWEKVKVLNSISESLTLDARMWLALDKNKSNIATNAAPKHMSDRRENRVFCRAAGVSNIENTSVKM
jgi:hypothetical protein